MVRTHTIDDESGLLGQLTQLCRVELDDQDICSNQHKLSKQKNEHNKDLDVVPG